MLLPKDPPDFIEIPEEAPDVIEIPEAQPRVDLDSGPTGIAIPSAEEEPNFFGNLSRSLEGGYKMMAANLGEFWASIGLFPEYYQNQADLLRQELQSDAFKRSEAVEGFELTFENVVNEPTNAANWLLNKVVETVPNIALSVGAGYLTGGGSILAQAGAQGIVNLPQTIGAQVGEAAHATPTGERRELTGREYLLASTTGTISGGFETLADYMLVGRLGRLIGSADIAGPSKVAVANELSTGIINVLKEANQQGGVEFATEGIQQLVENVGARYGWAPDRSLVEGLVESAIVGYAAGALTTGSTGAVGLGLQSRQEGKEGGTQEEGGGGRVEPVEGETGVVEQSAPSVQSVNIVDEAEPTGVETTVKEVTDKIISSQPMTSLNDLEQVGLAKADIDLIRQGFGLEAMPAPEERKWAMSLQGAVLEGKHRDADLIARSVITNPRPISDREYGGLVVRAAELMRAHTDRLVEVEQLIDSGDRFGAESVKIQADAILDALDNVTRAANLAATETARALAIRRMRIDAENFSPTYVLRQVKANKGAPLTLSEQDRFMKQAQDVQRLESRVQDMEAREGQLLEEHLKRRAEEVFKAQKKRKGAIEEARETEQEALDALKKLGARINSIFGVDPEALYHLGQYAIAKIREGALTLDDVVRRVQEKLPDAEAVDVYEALNTRNPKARSRTVSAVEARIRDLKSQARLMERIEKMIQGRPQPPTQKRKGPSAEVVRLRKLLSELKQTVFQHVRDEERLQRAIPKIEQLQEQLGLDYPTPSSIQQAQNLLTDLRAIVRAEEEIARLETVLSSEENVEAEAARLEEIKNRPKRVRLPELERTRIQLEIKRKDLRQAIANMRPLTTGEKITQVITLPRALLATADMSYALRQGLMLSVMHPVRASRAFSAAFRSYWSREFAEGIDLAMKSDPKHALRERYGLFLAPLEAGAVNAREELFMSRVAQRIPIWGSVMRAAERNMVIGLNMLRTGAFDAFLENNPTATDKELRAYADYVNVASGRGNLNPQAASTLSAVFFAPRFAISRFQTPWKMVQYFKHPTVRKEIAKDMVGFVSTGLTVLGLAAAAGLEVGLDPRDADFGKIRFGNTRVDIWGGFLTTARLIARMATVPLERAKIIEEAGRFDQTWTDMLMNFAKYKLAPHIDIPSTLVSGKNVIGEEQTVTETLARSVTPLFLQDAVEAWRGEGIKHGVLTGPLAFVGASVQTYGTELDKPDIQKVLKRADYSPRPPQYPDWVGEKMEKSMNGLYESLFAMKVRVNKPMLDMLPPAESKSYLVLLAAEARQEVLQSVGP